MEGTVISYLDILKKDETGIFWIGTASSMEEAHSQIRAHAGSGVVEYVIFDSKTGDRIAVNPGGGDA
jgi:hypothetical protein